MIDFRPDIIHCHDWQAGLIPVFLDNFRYGKQVVSRNQDGDDNSQFEIQEHGIQRE